MELWELEARESIRDLVARYNANGDSGRIEQVLELFTDDAVMSTGSTQERRGREEIRTIFTGAMEQAAWGGRPVYVRHMTATLQIDLADRDHATSRSYYAVITDAGLDHWGRYIDDYRREGGVWKFSARRVTTDGRGPGSVFA